MLGDDWMARPCWGEGWAAVRAAAEPGGVGTSGFYIEIVVVLQEALASFVD